MRGATTAILLIARAHLARGDTANLIETALSEYRDDPATYKENKAGWPDAHELGSLTKPQHVAYYRKLIEATDSLLEKFTRSKRQFNSLLELDNCLISSLGDIR